MTHYGTEGREPIDPASPISALAQVANVRRTPSEVEAAIDMVRGLCNRQAGTLKLNVPVSAARLVLPAIVT